MDAVDVIPVIINPYLLGALATIVVALWMYAFLRRRKRAGCLTEYDALIVVCAAVVWASFELLILSTDSYELSVALSRVMRLWAYASWAYLGYRIINNEC